jgi:hypothetical protein
MYNISENIINKPLFAVKTCHSIERWNIVRGKNVNGFGAIKSMPLCFILMFFIVIYALILILCQKLDVAVAGEGTVGAIGAGMVNGAGHVSKGRRG